MRSRCSVSARSRSRIPLGLGLMGMHGHKHVNDALDECDLLVNIGARFDDRATGQVSGFAQNAFVVHVDIDPAEIGKNVRTDVPVVGDAGEVLKLLIPEVEDTRHDDWMAWIDSRRDRALDEALEERPAWPEPYTIIKSIAEATNGEAIVTTDVGQHQMWAAQHFGFNHPDRWITSGGLGTMGFGLPSAIGAKIGRPDLEVWAVIGDGGFQMSLQRAGHRGAGEPRHQYRDHQQRLSGDGPPVAGSVPRQELLRGQDRRAELREAGRGVWHHRHYRALATRRFARRSNERERFRDRC